MNIKPRTSTSARRSGQQPMKAAWAAQMNIMDNNEIDKLVTIMAEKGRKAARKLAALSTSVK
ncbi:MAG: hypothetical protein D3909_05640, partial [Candidatus Electrothrix sp. ATG1]|nr:hypothetical protein [Candidatus Electrothrix sp. ATG1]